MNAIFNAVYQPYTLLCTDKLVKKYNCEKAFMVFTDEAQFKMSASKITEKYYHKECLKANYANKLFSEKLIPLDKELTDAFAAYMLMALKMCERVNDVDLSFEGRVELVYKSLEYWNTVIEKDNIALYVSYDIPHEVYDYIIYGLCKIKNIPCVLLRITPVLGHSTIVNDIEDYCPEIIPIYKSLLREYNNVDIDEIMLEGEYLITFNAQSKHNKDIVPFYMKGTIEEPHLNGWERAKNIVNLIAANGVKPIKDWVNIKQRKHSFKKSPAGQYHAEWNSYCKQPNLSEKYIYFPLHLQPECTTSPQGGCFTWQLLALKMLSAALPNGVYIYVKENPKQTQKGRTENFIQQMANIPKVMLLSKDFDTYSLIENCIAVASVTGTAVFEGLFKGKPGLMFGNVITQYAPGVYKIGTNAECENALQEILNNGSTHTLKDLKIFMLALQRVSALSFSWCPPIEAKCTNEEICGFLYPFMKKAIDNALQK